MRQGTQHAGLRVGENVVVRPVAPPSPVGGRESLDEIRASLRAQALNKATSLDQTKTPEFLAWFGGSKVIAPRGNPLVVYHGAPDIRPLRDRGVFQTKDEQFGVEDPHRAYFFTDNRVKAKTYADDTRAFDYQGAVPGVLNLFLKIENPKVINWGGKVWRGTREVVAAAKAAGHDGVIVQNVIDDYNTKEASRPATVYVVFDPRNIKSATENRGLFSPEDPDIRG